MSKFVIFHFIAVLNLFQITYGAPKLPPAVPLCKRNDPNLNECVRKAIQDSLNVMSHGVADLGIETLDPLKIDNIDIDKKQNDGRPVDVDLTFKDVSIEGASQASITSAVADWDHNMVSFESTFTGPLIMKGRYVTDGIVLILPIKGDGSFKVIIEGLKSHIKVHGNTVERDGAKYMEVDRLSWTFDADHMSVEFDNLFHGDEELAETMNAFLNDNWRDIMIEMTPAIEGSFSSHFQTVAEKVFNQIPIDMIALP